MANHCRLGSALRTAGLVFLSAVSFGCGGTASSEGSAGGSPSSGGAGGSGAAAGGGAAGGSAAGAGSGGKCPSVPPQAGSACTLPASASSLEPTRAHCSWGDDPRPECRTTAICPANHAWAVTEPDASCSAPPLPAECPASAASGECADQGAKCYYDTGTTCTCSPCKGGSQYPLCQTIDPAAWACSAPRAGCPALLPQAGSACSANGQECGPNCELSVLCENGAWVWRRGQCPICAAPNTLIATPFGEVAISELLPGDLVYSINANGIAAVPVLRVGRTPVFNHHVMRIELDSGIVLNISPGHPTANGKTFRALAAGDALDPLHAVKRAELVPYTFDSTYDILPASDTGTYFAGGAAIGSSLFHSEGSSNPSE